MSQAELDTPGALTAPKAMLWIALVLTLAAALFIQAHAPWYEGDNFWSILAKVDQQAVYGLLLLFALLSFVVRRLPSFFAELPELAGTYPLQISLTCTLVLALFARYAYLATPFAMDEYAPWFQAHVFAAGKLSAPLPIDLIDHLISPVFRNQFFAINQNDGQTISTYWPGFALLLTPFTWLGVPWLCNPVIVGLNLLIAWRLGYDVFATRRAAGWVLLLMLASPAVTLNGISFYSMPAHLLFNTLFVWLLLKATPVRYFLAGLTGAIACSLHNPFPHLVFALPWLFWALRRGNLRLILLTGLGYALLGAPLVLGWSIFKAPYVAATLVVNPATGLPLITNQGLPSGLLDTLSRILSGLFSYPSDYLLLARNGALVKLWAWSSPLLVLLAIYGLFTTRLPLLRYLASSAVITLLIYYFIRFDQGKGWGYRYFHAAYIVLPMLGTAALLRLEKVGRHHVTWQKLAPTVILWSILVQTPLLTHAIHEYIATAQAERPPELAGRGLYILTGRGECQGLRCDLLQNDPFLRGNVYLINRRGDKASETALLQQFQGAKLVGQNKYGRSYTLPETWRPTTSRTDEQR